MKKSLLFTILTLVLFFAQQLVSGLLIGTMNLDEVAAELIGIVIVLIIVFLLIHKKDQLDYYGLCIHNDSNLLRTSTGLGIVLLANVPYLFLGGKINIAYAVVSSIFVGIMEELIFRSFLCRFIEEKLGVKMAIIISSVLFGAIHLINLGDVQLIYAILQIVYAVAIGVAFSIVFFMTKSILSCIAVHAIVDLLGSFSTEPILTIEIIGTVLCCMVAVYYCITGKLVQRKED